MAQPLIGSIEIIQASWQNFQRNLRRYAEFMLILVLPGALLVSLGVFLRSVVPGRLDEALIFGLVSLPFYLAYAIINLAFIDFTAKTLQKKKADIRESVLIGAHKLISSIWIALLVGLIVLGGTILLIVPGIIFSLWYIFASNHLVVDGLRGFAALKASRALVVGRWWSVFWRVAVPTAFYWLALRFAVWIIYLIFGSILGDPNLFFNTSLATDSGWLTIAILLVVPIVIYSFGIALTVAASLVLWLDLKRTRA